MNFRNVMISGMILFISRMRKPVRKRVYFSYREGG